MRGQPSQIGYTIVTIEDRLDMADNILELEELPGDAHQQVVRLQFRDAEAREAAAFRAAYEWPGCIVEGLQTPPGNNAHLRSIAAHSLTRCLTSLFYASSYSPCPVPAQKARSKWQAIWVDPRSPRGDSVPPREHHSSGELWRWVGPP